MEVLAEIFGQKVDLSKKGLKTVANELKVKKVSKLYHGYYFSLEFPDIEEIEHINLEALKNTSLLNLFKFPNKSKDTKTGIEATETKYVVDNLYRDINVFFNSKGAIIFINGRKVVHITQKQPLIKVTYRTFSYDIVRFFGYEMGKIVDVTERT